MKKKYFIIALVSISLLGSFLCILATNMLFSDVANYRGNMAYNSLIASFPAVTLAAIMPMAFLYVIRLYKNPKIFTRMTRLYVVIAMSLSLIGFITSLLGGILFYKSFTKPYPFPGYLIIFMVIHLLILGGGIYLLLKLKNKQDETVYKSDVKHVVKTIGWYLFISLAFNRIGMFLAIPVYVQWSTLYLTFPFFLHLLIPLFIGLIIVLTIFDIIQTKTTKVLLWVIVEAANVVLFLIIILLAINNTIFISAVSAVMPFERLLTLPVEIIVHFVAYIVVSTIFLIKSLKN